uniref:Uncharacterized protein n=1 Tax=Varanus komodoensis TaxID=61221 RepID=A0A8D2LT69_VARKO
MSIQRLSPQGLLLFCLHFSHHFCGIESFNKHLDCSSQNSIQQVQMCLEGTRLGKAAIDYTLGFPPKQPN